MPFCFHSFLPEPATSPRTLVLCVPARMPAWILPHRFVQQRFVDFGAEHFVGQFYLADLLIIQIHYIDCRHGSYLFDLRTST